MLECAEDLDNVRAACGPRDAGDTGSCLGLWRWLLASGPAPSTAASAHGVRRGFSPLSSLEDLTLQIPDLPGHPCAAWRESGGPELELCSAVAPPAPHQTPAGPTQPAVGTAVRAPASLLGLQQPHPHPAPCASPWPR